MGLLYGDSTPFPHEGDYIEAIRRAVEQGVRLLAAQHAITESQRQSGDVERQRQTVRAQIASLSDALSMTLTQFRAAKSELVQQLSERIRDTVHHEVATTLKGLDGLTSERLSSNLVQVEAARRSAFCAVEAFVLRHDLPDTKVGLHLLAGENTYSGEAVVQTPFGVEAVFELAIPAAHDWGRPRRVVELSSGTEVFIPTESGIFSKKVEPKQVKLDRLFISEVKVTEDRTLISLRKGPRSGPGYQFEFLPEETLWARLRRLNEEGDVEAQDPLVLREEDGVHVMRLWNRVADTTADLAMRRQAMTAATFEGTPIPQLERPQTVCERLVAIMAPIVRDIARRSGAPGELVLRRDVGEGRREEVYITMAELQEMVLELPAEKLRAVFDPFDLWEGPRSPRAPAHSERIVLTSDELALLTEEDAEEGLDHEVDEEEETFAATDQSPMGRGTADDE